MEFCPFRVASVDECLPGRQTRGDCSIGPQVSVELETLVDHPEQKQEMQERPGTLLVGLGEQKNQWCHGDVEDTSLPPVERGAKGAPERPVMKGDIPARQGTIHDDVDDSCPRVGKRIRGQAGSGTWLSRSRRWDPSHRRPRPWPYRPASKAHVAAPPRRMPPRQ